MDSLLSLVILTYNEELNLPACIESIQELPCEIVVVDSGSTDRTVKIAQDMGCQVVYHAFETQAQQLNWALDHLTFKGDWVLRMDADERLTPELAQELVTRLPTLPPEITGLYIKRRTYFMGRWIRYGGYYPTWILRVWRTGKARCEGQYLNEHMILLEGTAAQLNHDLIDWNLKGLGFWVEKHNHYATRFARELTALQDGSSAHITSIKATPFGTQEQRKRWLKQQVYARLPLFFRSFVYFVYRYVFLGGFLDGKEGLMFHFLQGFWYHFLVDAKVYEHAKHLQQQPRH